MRLNSFAFSDLDIEIDQNEILFSASALTKIVFLALALSYKEEYHIFSQKYCLHLGGLNIDIKQNGIFCFQV